MGLLRFLAKLKFLPETRRLELYPPFYKMRAKILEASDGWRRVRIRLPLTAFSSNLSGDMFGGWQAALADPIAALACARVFPGYSVWTRSMSIAFEKPGSTDLELRFEITPGTGARHRRRAESQWPCHSDLRIWFLPGRWQPVHAHHQYRGHTPARLCQDQCRTDGFEQRLNQISIRPSDNSFLLTGPGG